MQTPDFINRHFSALGNHLGNRHLVSIMNTEATSPLAAILERARIACDAAERCCQRTSRIVFQSHVLMQRFDELDRKIAQSLSRNSNNRLKIAA
jgi:hypothetical protein